MTDGRIYTTEDEIDSLQVEIRQAKWRLASIERAPGEGRWTADAIAWIDAVANQKQRIAVLERDLANLAPERGNRREETEQSVSPSQPSQQSSRSSAPPAQPTTRQTPTK